MDKITKCILSNMCMVYKDDEILVIDRTKSDWPGLSFPGGHVEKGETLEESVIREMKEETGLTIFNPKLCDIKDWDWGNDTRYLGLLYKTDKFEGELKDSNEGKVFWIKKKDLKNYNLSQDFLELYNLINNSDKKKIKILAIGSSVTRGYATNGYSFVDMLNEYDDNEYYFEVIKEAIDGTTLANIDKDSYVARLRKYSLDELKSFDYILVQLSTNDLSRVKKEDDVNDETTTLGAINEFLKLDKSFNEPKIIFYTCFKDRDKSYEKRIESLKNLLEKDSLGFIDFYYDENFINQDFNFVMQDPVHPNINGYKFLTEKFAKAFINLQEKKK